MKRLDDSVPNCPTFLAQSLDDLLSNFARNETGVFERNRKAYRGQVNADWTLKPTLLRVLSALPREKALAAEEALLAQFTATAPLHVKGSAIPKSDNPREWWPLMQHHGAPTRLLDWTCNPYIAMYFASLSEFDTDGAIWFHNRGALASQMTKRGAPNYEGLGLDPNHFAATDKWCYSIHMKRPSARMLSQDSVFTLGVDVIADHVDLIGVLNEPDSSDPLGLVKIIIPKALKPSMLRRAVELNITAATLFPGIDGIGHAIHERATLYALGERAKVEV